MRAALTTRHQDEKLLHVAKLVASVFVVSDGGKLKHPPAPDGAVYVRSLDCYA